MNMCLPACYFSFVQKTFFKRGFIISIVLDIVCYILFCLKHLFSIWGLHQNLVQAQDKIYETFFNMSTVFVRQVKGVNVDQIIVTGRDISSLE